jgi:DNA-3-methyladenine glycosylase II
MKPQLLRKADAYLREADPVMAKLIDRYGPCKLTVKSGSPFEVLAAAIISQQLSNKAAATIQGRVVDLVGALNAEALATADPLALRACGLSNAKSRWLIAFGEAVTTGTLDFAAIAAMDNATAIRTLDALPGIGPWTAEMWLIFAQGREDLFSMGDVGLRNAINRLYAGGEKLDVPATLLITNRWAPYRSCASWYLWRLTDANDSYWG